jgi:hypothetical protein
LPEANDFDNVDPGDKKQMQILQALALATAITNANDLLDTPVPILLKQLQATVGAKYPAVNGYEANPVPGKAGTYDIVQFAKHRVKPNYTDGKEKEEEDHGPMPPLPDKVIYHDRTVRIWHNFGNLGDIPGSPKEHGPIHFHVKYQNKEYRAFPSGQALQDSEQLPLEVWKIFQSNKKQFYKIEAAIGSWFKYVKKRGWTNR